MKTIFRYANVGVLLAAILAVGAVTGFGQDTPAACSDTAGLTALQEKVNAGFLNYGKATLDERQKTIEASQQFIEKYGSCGETVKELVDYLNKHVPGLETKLAADRKAGAEKALADKFNSSLKSKNWDEAYSSGKALLATDPEKYRPALLALGSIGFDESLKTPSVTKYNDESLKFAKMAIIDMEAGKTFQTWNLGGDYAFKGKDDALGWLSASAGYLTYQTNRKEALPYLYKATQANSETKKNPIPYELIGNYYFDELNTLTAEITKLAAEQKPEDTAEVAQQKVDAIKAKVALANGTAERAMDAFARAYSLGAAKPYKDKMYKNLQEAYKLRFAKTVGLDAWIASTIAKPMPSPLTAVAPVFDADPSTTTTTSATTPPSTVKPADPASVKPAPAPGTKPAVTPAPKPASGMKPQAKIKKRVIKRKVA